MLENYRVYKVNGTVIGNFVTIEEAKAVASKHRGARIATKKSDSGGWNYTALQGKLF